MTTFNPRDWPRLPDWLDPHEGRRSPREINREALERCCMAAGILSVLCRPRASPPDALCVRRSAVPGRYRLYQPCGPAGGPAAGIAPDRLGRGGTLVHRKPRAAPLAWAVSSQLRSPTHHRSTCTWRSAMEQQTIRIGHNRLPPPFLTREQPWPVRVGEGGSKRPTDVSHLPADEWAAGANPAGDRAVGVLAARPRQPPVMLSSCRISTGLSSTQPPSSTRRTTSCAIRC